MTPVELMHPLTVTVSPDTQALKIAIADLEIISSELRGLPRTYVDDFADRIDDVIAELSQAQLSGEITK